MAKKRIKLTPSQSLLYQIAENDRISTTKQIMFIYGQRLGTILDELGVDVKSHPDVHFTPDSEAVYVVYEEPDNDSVPLLKVSKGKS